MGGNDDDGSDSLDNVIDSDSDQFSDTGFVNDEDVIPEHTGVRGPQSESILYPDDCKKLLQVCRGIRVSQGMEEGRNVFPQLGLPMGFLLIL